MRLSVLALRRREGGLGVAAAIHMPGAQALPCHIFLHLLHSRPFLISAAARPALPDTAHPPV